MQAPAEQLAGIASIAADVLAAPIDNIQSVERIKGGLNNESWLVTATNDKIVVRLSNADEEALQIDRRSECLVLAEVRRAGVGAEVLRCHPEGRVLVTRYIQGAVWNQEDAGKLDNIRRLAELLRRLHSLKMRSDVAETNLPAIVEHYWSTMSERGLSEPLAVSSRKEIRDIACSMQASAGHCLCHNDVHNLNIIDTGQLWLIDWEYAGIGNPWFDLASVCINHAFDETQRHHLLRHYLGHVDQDATVRLVTACTLFDYIRSVWLAVRGATRVA